MVQHSHIWQSKEAKKCLVIDNNSFLIIHKRPLIEYWHSWQKETLFTLVICSILQT